MSVRFDGHDGPGVHDPTSLVAAHCRACHGWCRVYDPCGCCLEVMTDQQVADLLDVNRLAETIYDEVGQVDFDPRPLAVRLWREGWRKS